jgi:transposase InsO family protein
LADQQSYSLHKPVRKNFKRNKTFVNGIDHLWQADLADMQKLSRENQGYHYILTVIDVFSKYAWAIPVKDKGSKSMLIGFQTLFRQSGRTPQNLQTDMGKEFLNKEVQNLLKTKNVKFYYTNSEKKAAVVERFNRTLKTRIWTYFSAQQTRKYVNVLQKIVNAYNNTVHRTIGMKPADVKPEHEDKLWVRMYGDGSSLSKRQLQLKEGDMVRVSKHKQTFDKGYLPNWTMEHFI